MNRLKYVDVAKGIGIILMVFNHFDYDNFPAQRFIASFHMPLFFFLSGYVFWNTNWQTKKTSSYIFNRFLQLMIPYYIFCFMWQTDISLNAAHTVFYSYTNIGPLWFLPCMFVASTIFFIENKCFYSFLSKNLFYIVILVLIDFVIGYILILVKKDLPFNIANAFMGVGYMLLGVFSYRFKKYIPKLKENKFFLLFFSIVSFGGVFYLANMNMPVYEYYSKRAVMATGDYGNIINYIPVSIIGCFATITIAKLLQSFSLLETIGNNSITILLLHYYYPKLLFEKLVYYMPIKQGSIFIPLIGTIFIIALCLPISFFLTKFVPSLVGKKIMEKNI